MLIQLTSTRYFHAYTKSSYISKLIKKRSLNVKFTPNLIIVFVAIDAGTDPECYTNWIFMCSHYRSFGKFCLMLQTQCQIYNTGSGIIQI